MKKTKLLKTLLIPTFGITAFGLVAAIATSCNNSDVPTSDRYDVLTANKDSTLEFINHTIENYLEIVDQFKMLKKITYLLKKLRLDVILTCFLDVIH